MAGLHIGLCKFAAQYISVDKYLKFGKTHTPETGRSGFLFISYNITIPWLYPLNGFRIIGLNRVWRGHCVSSRIISL